MHDLKLPRIARSVVTKSIPFLISMFFHCVLGSAPSIRSSTSFDDVRRLLPPEFSSRSYLRGIFYFHLCIFSALFLHRTEPYYAHILHCTYLHVFERNFNKYFVGSAHSFIALFWCGERGSPETTTTNPNRPCCP